jgi:hypothetical protein
VVSATAALPAASAGPSQRIGERRVPTLGCGDGAAEVGAAVVGAAAVVVRPGPDGSAVGPSPDEEQDTAVAAVSVASATARGRNRDMRDTSPCPAGAVNRIPPDPRVDGHGAGRKG